MGVPAEAKIAASMARHADVAELDLLPIDAGAADTVPAAQVGHGYVRLMLFQDPDDLYLGGTTAVQVPVLM